MKNIVSYIVRYPVFSNLLMIILILSGYFATTSMHKELLPTFSLDKVYVAVVYPDASPEEVEEAICIKVEEVLEGLPGIKKINSVASENLGRVTIDLELDADSQSVLNEIRSKVDSIDTFPDDAEKPQISELFRRDQVINLSISGPAAESVLKETAKNIRDELLDLKGVSQVTIDGVRNYEISIEVSETALREYGLSFTEVATAVRNSSLNVPGGTLRTTAQEIKLHTKSRKYTGLDYRDIIVLKRGDGTSVYLHEVATVEDGFSEDENLYGFFSDEQDIQIQRDYRSVLVSVFKTSDEDAIEIADIVKGYVEKKQTQLPPEMKLSVWGDRSIPIKERIDLLVNNGVLGFILVLITLGIFLSLRLSVWVALGIPVSFGGGLLVLWMIGGTINMISMFAMIMALGIVVDDAIVVGENIHSHHQSGASGITGAIQGTMEMAVPVSAAVLTTIVAFMPMLFVSGTMGKMIGQIPQVMIAVLSASLIECLFVLPAHLNHKKDKATGIIGRLQKLCDSAIEFLIQSLYRPIYYWSIDNKFLVIAVTVSITMVCMGLIKGGFVPFIFFPKTDSESLRAQIIFPEGTPVHTTEKAVKKIHEDVYLLNQLLSNNSGEQGVLKIFSAVGSTGGFRPSMGANLGSVTIQICSGNSRNIHSDQVLAEWRKIVGTIPDALSLSFTNSDGHPGGGQPIEIALLSNDYNILRQAAEDLKQELGKFEQVSDIEDDYKPGKLELMPKILPEGRLLGIDENMIGRQLNQGFAGLEALRIQRGADELKVKVRYPLEERISFQDLHSVRIRLNDGTEIPLTEVVDFSIERGTSQISRQNGRRRIRVLADVDEIKTPAVQIIAQLKQEFFPKLRKKYPEVVIGLEGQQQERRESMESLNVGYMFAMFGIFAILAIVFRSYIQPFIIMSVIPFGYIGAVFGHWCMDMPLTMMSVFGIVALSGIVVNDSLVLLDRINVHIRRGKDVIPAVQEAGLDRFRAILLTTLTTIAGLVPIMSETSLQAQYVIPMAISLSFGLTFATFLTLFLVPCLFLYLNFIRRILHWLIRGDWPTLEEVEPAYYHREFE